MADTPTTTILANAASIMDGKALDQAIGLSNDCVHLAWACLTGAGISMLIMAFAPTPKDTANSAMQTAKSLAGRENLATASIDIPKVIDAAKGVIDALTKASPLLVWMSAAVFFMGIGMVGVSNYAQQHPDRDICTETQNPGKDAGATQQAKVNCVKRGDQNSAPNAGDTHGTGTSGNQAGALHPDQPSHDVKGPKPSK